MVETQVVSQTDFNPVVRLTRDLKKAAATMSEQEIRYLVDAYYTFQENRKAAANQSRALKESGEPHEVLIWTREQAETMEAQIQRALDAWTEERELGRWVKSITGIGPVIAAGLMSTVDLDVATNAAKLWRFAGLDPTSVWEKGQKRPWNASLKRLCWIIGDSFVKQSGRDSDHYGQLYHKRKEYETKKNYAGEYADQCKISLATKKFGTDAEAVLWYSGALDPRVVDFVRQADITWTVGMAKKLTCGAIEAAIADTGKRDKKLVAVYIFAESLGELKGVQMLPPARVHLRCIRKAVSIFLEHFLYVGRTFKGLTVPEPYVFAYLHHSDRMVIPNFDMSRLKTGPVVQ